MTIALVIPARFASRRFPGKPLAPLRGATGLEKSLLARSWEAASAVAGVGSRHVATDDPRIAEEARRIGAPVLMTSPDCANGTERCAEAVAQLPGVEVVVNLQGDAPLTPPWFVEALIAAMADPAIAVATPVLRSGPEALAALRADRAAGRVGGTTAVLDCLGRALYFSKEVLPFAGTPDTPVYHHVGVYAYRRTALTAYAGWDAGALETAEGLEQLRFLENGVAVTAVKVESRGAEFWELNNPEDVPRIEAVLQSRGTP
ncbi:MAG: 3-deoxy-manno-octulosonate cytidylyltransferase [Paracoccaceae bacterium]